MTGINAARAAASTESLGLGVAHGYNSPVSRGRHSFGRSRHPAEGRCSSLKDLFRIPKPRIPAMLRGRFESAFQPVRLVWGVNHTHQRRPFADNEWRTHSMSAVLTPAGFTDFKVADISLADWGRKELIIAESEMISSLRPQ